jgi:hypothetical protein
MGLFSFAGIFIIVFIVAAICLIPEIFFILTLQKALQRCSPENRVMTPGSTWLILIPVFNLVWMFIVVTQMAQSLEKEFRKRTIPVEPSPGKSIGLAWCILTVCCLIPLVGILTGLPAIICWILYWVKIAGFSSTIADPTPTLSAVSA